MKTFSVIFLILSLSLSLLAEEDKKLMALIAQCDKEQNEGKSTDTIPIEKRIIKLRDSKEAKKLEIVLEHKKFGVLAAWALSEIGDESSVVALLAALKTQKELNNRSSMALYIGAFATDEVRNALRAEMVKATVLEKDEYRAALLRARDTTIEKETLLVLGNKDPRTCAQALLIIGNSRREDLIPSIVKYAKDERLASGSIPSKFQVVTITKTTNGSSSSTTYPILKTVGNCAIEAASRCVSTTTPGMIAWWYETELEPRYPAGEIGITQLTLAVDALNRATNAKAKSMKEVTTAVISKLHTSLEEGVKLKITGISFEKQWEVRYRLIDWDGEQSGDEKIATIDNEGRVKLN